MDHFYFEGDCYLQVCMFTQLQNPIGLALHNSPSFSWFSVGKLIAHPRSRLYHSIPPAIIQWLFFKKKYFFKKHQYPCLCIVFLVWEICLKGTMECMMQSQE